MEFMNANNVLNLTATLFLFGIVMLGCSKKDIDPIDPGPSKVNFRIESSAIPNGKVESIAPKKLSVKIENAFDEEEIEEILPLTQFGNGYISVDAVELIPGDYNLTEFLVIGDDEGLEKVIYATPVEGSERAYLVNEDERLPLPFSIIAEEVTTLVPTVLEVNDQSDPGSFGYGFGSFSFNIIETFILDLAVISGSDSSYLPFNIVVSGYTAEGDEAMNEVVSTNGLETTALELSAEMNHYTFEVIQAGYYPLTHYYGLPDLMEKSSLPFIVYDMSDTEMMTIANEFKGLASNNLQPIIAYFPKDGCRDYFAIDFGGFHHDGGWLSLEVNNEDNSIQDLFEITYPAPSGNSLYPVVGSNPYGYLAETNSICDNYAEEDNLTITKNIYFSNSIYELIIVVMWNKVVQQWTYAGQFIYDNDSELVFEEIYDWNN